MFANSFYRNYSYSADDNILVLIDKEKIPSKAKFFIVSLINKTLYKKFDYSKQYRMGSFNETKIQLPTKNGKIDFDFMENFINNLETERMTKLDAYLVEDGLHDYELSAKEKQVLLDFEKDKIKFGEFTYQNIFNNIKQGRRLKKDDQILGDIPFVMAGVTDTGIVNHISNPVATFPKNSITIDIFGNTFYRNYDYGAGDDTGVYWNDKTEFSKETMLFFASSMEKSIFGKFDYGNKLRSSKSLNFKMKLPIKSKNTDYEIMETLISAIQKTVVKDVVLYVKNKGNC
ncbi:restriction endonuclease [Tenacibaculum dicentrarchi]|nr:restriction endonuclease [Tenacibaculum dicentrarchi]